jgi:hypothetical protein
VAETRSNESYERDGRQKYVQNDNKNVIFNVQIERHEFARICIKNRQVFEIAASIVLG